MQTMERVGAGIEGGIDEGCSRFFSYGRFMVGFWMLTMVLIICVFMPLMIVKLHNDDAESHTYAWFSAFVFVCLAVPISIWDIAQHLRYWHNPTLQRYIVRILWMVPIYAVDSFIALRYPGVGLYFRVVRECYEAYVIYNFFMYLFAFLMQQDPNFIESIRAREPFHHMWGLHRCMAPWQMGPEFVKLCQTGPLVYVTSQVLCTIVTFACQKAGVYHIGSFSAQHAYIYLAFIQMFTQTYALYCLVLFGYAFKSDLAPIAPIQKFLVIKAVVFFTFYQSVTIAFLVKVKVIQASSTESITYYQDTENVSAGLQDFIICIEMFLAALAHHRYFSYKEHMAFVDDAGNYTPMGTRQAIANLFDVKDVKDDVLGSFKSVANTVSDSVAAPFRKSPPSSAGDEAQQSLLAEQPAASSSGYGT
jgi:hypothetical protein